MVHFTIPSLERETARAIEPFAPWPEARFAAMKDLADAGIDVGLAIAPIIPGLNEHEIPALLQRAKECGARTAFIKLLRLPGNVEPYFIETPASGHAVARTESAEPHSRSERRRAQQVGVRRTNVRRRRILEDD